MSSTVPMLFVTWQAPESRRFFPIARVLRLPSGEYEWAYLRAATEAVAHDFAGLPGYEDLEAVSVSADLPATFAHRAPPRHYRRAAPRAANDTFDPAPITLLVPSGPGQFVRLEVFAPPLPASRERYFGVFMARGVGRIPGTRAAVDALAPNEALRIAPEPDNPYNPHALLLLRAADAAPIGYVPDYLANELAEVLGPGEGERGAPGGCIGVEVLGSERVHHPPAEPLYIVPCRYTCAASLGRCLFRSERYQPLSPAAYRL